MKEPLQWVQEKMEGGRKNGDSESRPKIIWVLQIEICYKYKIYAVFEELVKKNVKFF
jgi:hypothetical protein